MSDESLVSQLHSLGLRAPASSIEALLTHATKSRLSPIQTLEQLCALCHRERELNNLARRTKDAALGSVLPLDRFDWSHPRSIDQPLYERLLTLDFLAPGHNVLFRRTRRRRQSHPGAEPRPRRTGRELHRPLLHPRRHSDRPAQVRLLRTSSSDSPATGPQLLILDEIGYLPCDQRAAEHPVQHHHPSPPRSLPPSSAPTSPSSSGALSSRVPPASVPSSTASSNTATSSTSTQTPTVKPSPSASLNSLPTPNAQPNPLPRGFAEQPIACHISSDLGCRLHGPITLATTGPMTLAKMRFSGPMRVATGSILKNAVVAPLYGEGRGLKPLREIGHAQHQPSSLLSMERGVD